MFVLLPLFEVASKLWQCWTNLKNKNTQGSKLCENVESVTSEHSRRGKRTWGPEETILGLYIPMQHATRMTVLQSQANLRCPPGSGPSNPDQNDVERATLAGNVKQLKKSSQFRKNMRLHEENTMVSVASRSMSTGYLKSMKRMGGNRLQQPITAGQQ